MTNRTELKAKIIKELLPSLSLDPCGDYVNAKELSKRIYNSVENYRLLNRVDNHGGDKIKPITVDPKNILTKEDYKEINGAVVEDIKLHANEGKIDSESEGELTVIKHVSGKKHYKEGFSPYEGGEGIEIERVLTKFQKSKELKKQLLNSLSEWGIDFSGNVFTPISESSIDWEGDAKGIGKILVDKEQFTEMDYQELKQKVIEDIKTSLKKGEFDNAVCGWDKKEATKMNEYLVLKSSKDPKRIYYKNALSLQEGAEIEQVLSQSQQQVQIEQPPKSNFPFFGSSSGSGKH